MTPAAYFDEMVKPTIDEFEADPTSTRRAYAACMFAWHFADAVLVHDGRPANRKPREAALEAIRKGIAAHANPDRAYWTVADFANLVKHLKLTNPNLPFTLKAEDTHVGGAAAFLRGRFFKGGRTLLRAGKVVRNWDDQGVPIDLRWCLRTTRSAIEAYLTSRPELGWPQVPAPVNLPPAPSA